MGATAVEGTRAGSNVRAHRAAHVPLRLPLTLCGGCHRKCLTKEVHGGWRRAVHREGCSARPAQALGLLS